MTPNTVSKRRSSAEASVPAAAFRRARTSVVMGPPMSDARPVPFEEHNGFKARFSPLERSEWHIEIWTPGRDTRRPPILAQILDFDSKDEAERWAYSWIDRHGGNPMR
jgi:hypothetical protein